MTETLKQFPSADEMDKMLADRIKNKFRPKLTTTKKDFKKVTEETPYESYEMVHKGEEFFRLFAESRSSDLSLN